jgi:shikimate kinase
MNTTNITLIGMPASGKSTAGVLLARSLNKSFVDTDILIQQSEKMLLQEIIDSKGIDYFMKRESSIIESLSVTNHVIATGGSAVYSDSAMAHLSEISTIIFLDVSLEQIKLRLQNITTRGLVIKNGQDINKLYDERYPLYLQHAHFIMNCQQNTIEETVTTLHQMLATGSCKN